MAVLSAIPLNSPQRTHTKRDLPSLLASTYPHGHISGHARSPPAQRALEARRTAILRSMDAAAIENAYQATAARIRALLDSDRRRNEEIDREVDKVEAQRRLERKIICKQREERKVRDGRTADAEADADADETEV